MVPEEHFGSNEYRLLEEGESATTANPLSLLAVVGFSGSTKLIFAPSVQQE